jgi:hypothetical protein
MEKVYVEPKYKNNMYYRFSEELDGPRVHTDIKHPANRDLEYISRKRLFFHVFDLDFKKILNEHKDMKPKSYVHPDEMPNLSLVIRNIRDDNTTYDVKNNFYIHPVEVRCDKTAFIISGINSPGIWESGLRGNHAIEQKYIAVYVGELLKFIQMEARRQLGMDPVFYMLVARYHDKYHTNKMIDLVRAVKLGSYFSDKSGNEIIITKLKELENGA